MYVSTDMWYRNFEAGTHRLAVNRKHYRQYLKFRVRRCLNAHFFWAVDKRSRVSHISIQLLVLDKQSDSLLAISSAIRHHIQFSA